MAYTYTTQAQVRAAFWRDCDGSGEVNSRRRINGEYSAGTRCAFVDFVDALQKDGQISEALADGVTL